MELEQKKPVDYEIAQKTVTKWLDSKKITQQKRDSAQPMIDNLVESVVNGNLALLEDNKWKHILVYPIENSDGEVTIDAIEYKHRITDRHLAPFKRIVKGDDFTAILKRTMLALTNKPLGVINELDASTDRLIAEAIAVFFV